MGRDAARSAGAMPVAASLRGMLDHIVDYAGLFPPAALPLDDAIRQYAGDIRSDDAWMLARFVCPSARLAELSPYLESQFGADRPLHLSVLGRGGDDLGLGLAEDLAAIATCQSSFPDRVVVDAIETRLPESLASRSSIEDSVSEALGAGEMPVFLESTRNEHWRERWTEVMEGLAAVNRDCGSPRSGFKLRCGGLEPDAFPTVEEVAGAIWLAREAGVPMKFTAGLHHPVRRHDRGVGAMMHGFLNVFLAGAYSRQNPHATEGQVGEILACEDPSEFSFTDTEATCGPYTASRSQVVSARRDAVVSFGSCSFSEPRDDLRELGLLA